MRFKLLFIFSLTIFCAVQLKAQTLYGSTIKTDEPTYNLIKDAVLDMQYQIAKATGIDFKIDTHNSSATEGIVFTKLDATKNPAYDKRLNPLNDDAVLLRSDGEHQLEIISYTRQGLINGIYTYLDTLGFKWYLPGDEWAHTPKLKSIGFKCNTVYVPDFALRTFFGTWGTPRNRVVDNKSTVDREWNMWSTRNRLGGAYELKGHSWGTFFHASISSLLASPEYMAVVNGVRVKADQGSKKFCISNTGFQKLFTDYFVEELNKSMKADPNKTIYTISVEPSDGEGDCECEACKKMGSVSTRDFFLANEVGKSFQKISPKAYVNLYAYNTHAAPPELTLEPNVIVQIIPYGYQSFSSPEQMIEAWKKKSNNLFIYDYYGLPILNVDEPLHNSKAPWRFADRIKYWHANNIKGITLESSYSIGCTGVGLYMFTRLSWDVHADQWQILKEYYHNCYGPAYNAVWLTDLHLADDSMEKSQVLTKAMLQFESTVSKMKFTPEQKTRITNYKAYLHYLKLLYLMQKNDNTPDTVAADNLLRYVYSIFMRKEVHPFPINEWMINYGHHSDFVKKNWSTFNNSAEGQKFSSVVQLTDAEIDKLFDEDCKTK